MHFTTGTCLISIALGLMGTVSALAQIDPTAPVDASGISIIVGGFSLAIPLALISSNVMLWLIPPVRHALDENARGAPGASFKTAIAGLTKALLFLSGPSIMAILLGALHPWR